MTGPGKLKVINLFAGPGAGKSFIRAGIFSEMKLRGMKVEEVTEYAKDLTWDENEFALADQLFILANQNRKLERLRGKVEWVVSDSPILLGLQYRLPEYLPATFEKLVWELWETYDNYNYFIKRSKKYDPVGRKQSEKEAENIDLRIVDMLSSHQINQSTHFHSVIGGRESAGIIVDDIQRYVGRIKS